MAQARDDERVHIAPSRKRRKIGLLIAGVAVFGAGYVGSLATYAINSEVFEQTLLVPILGPWLSFPDLDQPDLALSEGERTADKAVLVLQGLLQASGLIIGSIGLAQYSSSRRGQAAARADAPVVAFAPLPGGALGIVRGAF